LFLSDVRRLTDNQWEDGTPAWRPMPGQRRMSQLPKIVPNSLPPNQFPLPSARIGQSFMNAR